MIDKVFVYGSLKAGFGNHALLTTSTYLGQAQAYHVELYSLGAFPALVMGEETCHGEVYEVDEETLANLDRLEGHPTFYRRELMTVCLEGEYVLANVYVYQHSVKNLNLVEDGRW